MARAYRHDGPGSTKQLLCFVDQRIGEIRRELGELGSSHEMWTRFDERVGSGIPDPVRELMADELGDNGEIVEYATEEFRQYELLRQFLLQNACPTCNGAGEERTRESLGEPVVKRNCPQCFGSGNGT